MACRVRFGLQYKKGDKPMTENKKMTLAEAVKQKLAQKQAGTNQAGQIKQQKKQVLLKQQNL